MLTVQNNQCVRIIIRIFYILYNDVQSRKRIFAIYILFNKQHKPFFFYFVIRKEEEEEQRLNCFIIHIKHFAYI